MNLSTISRAPADPLRVYDKLTHLGSQILPPRSTDITLDATDELVDILKDASAVVSMVGILTGSKEKFDLVQKKGSENVARAAKDAGVGRMVMISAIGADEMGVTP